MNLPMLEVAEAAGQAKKAAHEQLSNPANLPDEYLRDRPKLGL